MFRTFDTDDSGTFVFKIIFMIEIFLIGEIEFTEFLIAISTASKGIQFKIFFFKYPRVNLR